ncbi:hypothetical protein ASB62_01660 [Chlorobium limicola]|uniref:L-lactate permease n=2 Tax=Chlorobium limicola TaxID=1092 RepID=A0A101JSY9_CHLLI|nr:hypothetical protein ASB62_01660 [Chlorobium limicola]
MTFFAEFNWWLLLTACLVMALLPSFIRPFRTVPLLGTLLIWSALLIAIWFRFDAPAAIAGLLISVVGGVLAFLLTVFFSGLDLMAKKRYR